MSAVILVLAVAVWSALHSWLASTRVKSSLGATLGRGTQRFYRLGYNGLAVLSFLPVLILMVVLPDRVLYVAQVPWRYVMLAAEAVAAMLLTLTLLATDVLHFAGLRQIFTETNASALVKDGFYRWVRHPLYLFGLLIIWLTPFMTTNMLAVFASLTVYIIVGARFEEARLLQEFGEAYRQYQEHTPVLIPRLLSGRHDAAAPRHPRDP